MFLTALLYTFAVIIPAEAYGETQGNSCMVDPDRIWIEDLGDQAAVLYFYNSPTECCTPRAFDIESDNGIRARIVVVPNAGPGKVEKILIIPEDGQHFVYPTDEDYVPDQTMAHKYTIAGGLS